MCDQLNLLKCKINTTININSSRQSQKQEYIVFNIGNHNNFKVLK